jgi:PKD repeat protein
MKLKIGFLMFLCIQMQSWSQEFRYTNDLFSSSTSITNVVYGSAPALNGPFYSNEASTTLQNLVMDIFKPTGDSFTLRPAIIFAHSGGFFSGNRNVNDMMAFCDLLAKKGYVTATIDYRLGFSIFDNAPMRGTRAVYRGLQDGRAAIRYMRANSALYGVDPNKIYFIGSSAGSFIALHSIYLDTVAEKPAFAGTTTYNITSTAPDLGPLDIGTNLLFNGKPDAVVSLWGAVQSTSLITQDNNTPILLVHGEADTVVPFNTGSPFGYPSLPQADGSNPINTKLDVLGFTNKETYFVPGQGHEFYGTTNGNWSNGIGGNSYWPIVFNKIVQFLWRQHKPLADYIWNSNNLSVTYTDNSTGGLAWWWDFGDGNFSNEQSPTHLYSTEGTYQVKLYVENNNKSWDEIVKTITVTNLSNTEHGQEFFSISPNPTSNSIKVHWKSYKNDIKYQLCDISGKVISSNSLTNSSNEISLISFSNGMYFLKISADEINQIIKILKE